MVSGGSGVDRIYGGSGVDRLRSRGDGKVDYVSCGPGVDEYVNAQPAHDDPVDVYASDCENIAY